jgi:uncharacterized protein
MHVHVAGIGAKGSGCFLHPKIRSSFKFGIYLHAFDVSEKELADSGDALVLDRLLGRMRNTQKIGAAVVLALDGVIVNGKLDTQATQIYVPNDFVRRETSKRPGLLYGASINPARPHALQRLRQAALEGAVLVKWIPSIMLIDPADTGLTSFYREMKRLHLPLLTHTGTEKSFLKSNDTLSDPERLRLPLDLGVTVIAAQAGVPGSKNGKPYWQTLQEMFREYPNLYADISSLTQLNKLGSLKPLLSDSVSESRLLYGSDYPLNFTRLVAPMAHTYSIGIQKVKSLNAMPEHWDRDIALKVALGVSQVLLNRGPSILLQPSKPPPPQKQTRKKRTKRSPAHSN